MAKLFNEHVGGAFIYSEKPKKLADWYKKHLGIEYKMVEAGGASFASFYYGEKGDGKKPNFAWSIIKSKYRTRTEDELYMVNYRVNDLGKLVEQLTKSKVKVTGVEDHKEGKFAWINDPEGNRIELWEDTNQK